MWGRHCVPPSRHLSGTCCTRRQRLTPRAQPTSLIVIRTSVMSWYASKLLGFWFVHVMMLPPYMAGGLPDCKAFAMMVFLLHLSGDARPLTYDQAESAHYGLPTSPLNIVTPPINVPKARKPSSCPLMKSQGPRVHLILTSPLSRGAPPCRRLCLGPSLRSA